MPATSVGDFIRSLRARSRRWNGFHAVQTIETTALKVEATIRYFGGSNAISADYTVYENPWAELEESLTGQIEFVGSELCGLHLDCRGASTWVHDPSRAIAVKKIGRHLFEPIPGVAALGEIGFLETMARDFLVRDLGEVSRDDRRVRRLALKPKHPVRLHLFSSEHFPIRRAHVEVDLETLFPVHISVMPSDDAPVASLLGPNAEIRVSYRDVTVHDSDDPPPVYDPPADARQFEERPLTAEDIDGVLPVSIDLHSLASHGFDPARATGIATISTDSGRGFLVVAVPSAGTAAPEDGRSPHIGIAVGNYTSHNMARRRATFSEHGTAGTEDAEVLLLDRAPLWSERVPGVDSRHAPVEAFFVVEDTLWFLTAGGVDVARMEAVAHDLRVAQSSA